MVFECFYIKTYKAAIKIFLRNRGDSGGYEKRFSGK